MERWTTDEIDAFTGEAISILAETCGYDRGDESLNYQLGHSIAVACGTSGSEEARWGVEFRFCGALGFGGKFHLHPRHFRWPKAAGVELDYRCYVSCYPENRSDERDAMIAEANEKLSALCDRHVAAASS